MRRLALAALVLASTMLGGCIFAVGSGDRADDKRMRKLEERISRAEQKLDLGAETKQ
jgi:outer membrane murein-binding lipoprotein Lpp